MERHFDDELKKLNINLLMIATLTEEAIHQSIEALKTRNKALAMAVIERDQAIDELENTIDEECLELLALYQPMASDLRFITTGMKISMELERIADLAVNICQRVLELADKPLLKPLIDIPRLAENSKQMVRKAIDSFVKHDLELAKDVILSDKLSNELRTNIMHELIEEFMMRDNTTISRGIALLLVTRDLERISDRAASIAEDVIYMIKAKIVKHHINEFIDNQPLP